MIHVLRFCLILLAVTGKIYAQQNVAINADGSPPNPKAMLDIKSNNKGLLIPRLTSAERNNISTPPEGLMVYDTDLKSFFFFKNAAWQNMVSDIQLPYNGTIAYNGSAFAVTNSQNAASAIGGDFGAGDGIGLYAHGTIAGKFLGGQKGIDVIGSAYFYAGNSPGVNIDVNGNNLNALLVERGKTGLGTINPEAQLHISIPIAGNPVNLFKATGYAGVNDPGNLVNLVYKIQQPINIGGPMQPFLGTESNHPFHFITNNDMDNPTMSIFNNKVGINKTDGTYALSINGITGIYEGNQYMGQIAGNATTGNLLINAKTHPSDITLTKNLLLQTSITNQKTGFVGINTAAPTAFLEVHKDDETGKTAIIGNSRFDEGSNNLTSIRGGNANGNGGLSLNEDIPANVTIAYGGGDVFIANGGGDVFIPGGGDVMIANTSSHVSIGTTDKTYKLNVNGTIRSKELIVESNNWPDYVFEDKYKLTPLEEVEAFIQQNKHLPVVPSAANIQANGLKVSEIFAKMMEKIEELTLYIIEQNKKIKKLEADFTSLKNNQNK